MKKIQIKVTEEYLQDNWMTIFFKKHPFELDKKVYEAGYRKGDGEVIQKNCAETKEHLFTYIIGKKDILFKQFKKWKPEWKRKKEILFRKFI